MSFTAPKQIQSAYLLVNQLEDKRNIMKFISKNFALDRIFHLTFDEASMYAAAS